MSSACSRSSLRVSLSEDAKSVVFTRLEKKPQDAMESLPRSAAETYRSLPYTCHSVAPRKSNRLEPSRCGRSHPECGRNSLLAARENQEDGEAVAKDSAGLVYDEESDHVQDNVQGRPLQLERHSCTDRTHLGSFPPSGSRTARRAWLSCPVRHGQREACTAK